MLSESHLATTDILTPSPGLGANYSFQLFSSSLLREKKLLKLLQDNLPEAFADLDLFPFL